MFEKFANFRVAHIFHKFTGGMKTTILLLLLRSRLHGIVVDVDIRVPKVRQACFTPTTFLKLVNVNQPQFAATDKVGGSWQLEMSPTLTHT